MQARGVLGRWGSAVTVSAAFVVSSAVCADEPLELRALPLPERPLEFEAFEGPSRPVGEARLEAKRAEDGTTRVVFRLALAGRRARFSRVDFEWSATLGAQLSLRSRTERLELEGREGGGDGEAGLEVSELAVEEGHLVRRSEGLLGPEERRQAVQGAVHEGLPSALLIARLLPSDLTRRALPSVAWETQEGPRLAAITLTPGPLRDRTYGERAHRVRAILVDQPEPRRGCLGDVVVFVTADGSLLEVRSLQSPLQLLRGGPPSLGEGELQVREVVRRSLVALRAGDSKALAEQLADEVGFSEGRQGKLPRADVLRLESVTRMPTLGVERELDEGLLGELVHVESTSPTTARAWFGELALGHFELAKEGAAWRIVALPNLLY